MRVLIVINPGSNDFPLLKPLPKEGQVVDVDGTTAEKLIRKGLGVCVDEPIKAVPEEPAIQAEAPAEARETKQPTAQPVGRKFNK